MNIFKRRRNKSVEFQKFLDLNLPIFWVIGPASCGKTTLAEMLAKSSKFRLLKIDDLMMEEMVKGNENSRIITSRLAKKSRVPSQVLINIIMEALKNTCQNAIGFIIEGFPYNKSQAALFEKKICPVSLVIYVTLVLDALLARKVNLEGAFEPEEERLLYIESTKRFNKIAKKYEHKLIKLQANYPPEDTCTRLVENLEDFWGYKFLRLYVKN